MAYFEWGNDLVIDQGPIDEDHKYLVDLVNELHTATSQGLGREVVGEILERLVTHTRAHIQREEQIMAAAKFPQLSGHQLGHNDFMDNIVGLQQKFAQGSLTVASQLSILLRDWLSIHIRRSDRELMLFMTQKNKRR